VLILDEGLRFHRDVSRPIACTCSARLVVLAASIGACAPAPAPPPPPAPIIVSASASQSVAPPPPPAVEPPRPGVDLDCTTDLKWTDIGASRAFFEEEIGLTGDTRWLALGERDESGGVTAHFAVVLRDGGAPTLVKLAEEYGVPVAVRVNDAGAVGAQFKYKPHQRGTSYSPVDVDVVWVDASTGNQGKARFPKLPPFKVGRRDIGALIQPVEGGVLISPRRKTSPPIHLGMAGGKTEVWTGPQWSSTEWLQAVKVGGILVLGANEGDDGADLSLAMTKNKGKTWKYARWKGRGGAQLMVAGGAAAVVFATPSGEVAVVPVGDLPANHPEWKPAAAAPVFPGCDAKEATSARWRHVAPGEVRLRVKLPTGKVLELESRLRVTRARADGQRCTAAIATNRSPERYEALVVPHDLEHAHLLSEGRQWAKLSCKKR
jgi:hypothetical protein